DGLAALGQHDLDEQQPRARVADGPAAVPQDDQGAAIVPVVDDPLHDVQVTAGRDRLEEVAADRLAAAREPPGGQLVPGAGDDVRGVEDDAAGAGVGLEDGGQEAAVAAADVHDRAVGREVERLQDRRADGGCP